MPSAIHDNQTPSHIVGGNDIARPRVNKLEYSGSLDKYTFNDVTPVIGREFEGLQIRDLLKQDDRVIRDLAVTGAFPLIIQPLSVHPAYFDTASHQFLRGGLSFCATRM